MKTNTKKAYSEIFTIINLLDEDFKNKIPDQLMDFFEKEKDENYKIDINPNISLEEQNLLQETIDILAMLKLSYWCSDENEKQELLDLLNENEKRYQDELQKKYNSDDLFKNRNALRDEKEQMAMIKYKNPSFITLILNKIRTIFAK